ncbi:adenosylmethionine--8-amino-7-oxononanoate transaminase [Candidatus Marithrix sp. Canyon 246]|uniref:adenosylmethionine--8-amino-7-oxononanoate transaminase n=1 Tax=Candidatus Marithrix sp. Canyon 246 TaxID=1827136 RepID=UPI00084A07CD|nr:adenosylmethionine--8-amino-7-oxononanoate transaminase [Candidatus Marithrix sp. Canyon 246]
MNLTTFDKQHIWHPYAAMGTPVYPVVSANGVYIKLANGQELIDGMASWWSVIHGYNHPILNAAIHKQVDSMAHVMFGGLTHQPAVDLARLLIEITPNNLENVFFSDSGSVAVEVAIKMAIQYCYAVGNPKKQKLLTIRNGYHGDTFGAMAVCDPVNGMHNIFSHVLAQHYFAENNINSFQKLLEQHHNEIAAVILEPLLQGAGGMRIYSAEFLRSVRSLCDEYKVLLILDEIATGFGRTGTLFACERADISPDILCVGKALTGGYMSLAATLTSKQVSEVICSHPPGVFMHGPTFMANPLACSVAAASINLLLESPWQQTISNIEQQLIDSLSACAALPQVADVRILGAVGIVELQDSIDVATMQQAFVDKGVWIRPFRNLIYIMPPYIITPQQLSQLTQAIFEVIKATEPA